ncbi:hypothetical protein TWF225_005271 [Orbilia oligospora]|nr:hypothetical protein TWF225_005271 [Orbilia oligospora]KAF3185497.1 hypothetical protein TWF225_005271 [Orbilia oligospora]KAF3252345.1 hypothetical protein TWF128_006718 [Orbilia oligospora]KAF3252346.1 hypothetical protein TWF128_006718 [Orbilia oligospora]KAF3258054.1 hypothetical protein TWF217_005759 [Orbilia oligospora]
MEDYASQKHHLTLGQLVTILASISLFAPAVSTFFLAPNVRGALDKRKREGSIRLTDLYEDEDGVVTEDSERQYSVRLQKSVVLLAAAAGTGCSYAASLRSMMHNDFSFIIGWWGYTAAWTLILLHSLYFQFERDYLKTFSCAIHLLTAASIMFIARGTEFILSFTDLQVSFNAADWWLWSGQVVAATILTIAASCVPRRPSVEKDGKKVDDANSSSAYSLLMFAWMSDLFAKGWKTGHLEESDMKLLPATHRTKELYEKFRALKQRNKLWWTIFSAHRGYFAVQYLYQTAICLTQFLPHFMMLQILKALEHSAKKPNGGPGNAWVWVVGLFAAMIVNSTFTNALFWISFGQMNLFIRNELASLIFNKTMRKKDVKGGQKAEEKDGEADSATDSGAETEDSTAKDKKKTKEESEEDSLKGLRQGVVNLIAVDSVRVADFGCWSFIFYEAALSIGIGFAFLWQILGWQSICSGLVLYVVLTPINQFIAKIYLEASDKVMKVRDKKLAVVSEALQGIRQIKFAALEDQWQKRIEDVRKDEMNQVWITVIANTWLMACWIFGPIFLAAICLGTYAVIYGSLTPAIAFTALAVFQELEFAMSIVPELIGDMMDAKVSAERIQKHLDSAEKEDYIKESSKIAFTNATIAWASDSDEKEEDRFVIRDINIDFPVGELSLITGATGSGKSLMLAALLGEADLLTGSLEMPRPLPKALRYDSKANSDGWVLSGSTAYVSQIPWIENATIKDNILFCLPFDEKRYNEVIRVCSLKKDMEMLEDGDMTAIGEQGINLSGGQKWRISLARAVYSRAGILIFDDIFSAVDAHVGKEIFNNCLTGEIMKGRTRILVTHHVQLCLPKTEYIVELKEGQVERAASVTDLKRTGSLTKIIEQEEEAQKHDQDMNEELAIEVIAESSGQANGNTNGTTMVVNDAKKPRTFVEKEAREKGAIKFSVYSKYIQSSGGIPFWMICIGFFVVSQALNLGRQWWMKLWTGSEATAAAVHLQTTTSFTHHVSQQFFKVMTEEKSLTYWLGFYVLICFLCGLFATLKYFVVALGSYHASINLFNSMTHTILRAPTRWFDTTPVGRILNRFSADFTKIDSNLAGHIAFFGYSVLSLVGIVIAAAFITPVMLVCAVVLFGIGLAIAVYYLKTAREIKRIESVNKSPIFELFGSVLLGVGTIRAFGEGEAYIEKMDKRIDTYAQATYYTNLANRWMGIRMTYLGAVFSTLVGGLVVTLPNMDAALAGFAMSFAMEYTFAMIWALRRYADLELDFNAAERVIEYSVIEIEDQSGATPPAAWPHEGKVEVKDLVVAYAEDLDPVLKGISFDVKPRERVGVVGRTGAGKSSLTLAVFRFLRAREGSIVIDGLDISKITLKDLRSRIAIIPQDPVLFSGTIRSNLDPFGDHTDEDCRNALSRVNLVNTDTTAPASGTATPIPQGAATPGAASTTGSTTRNTNIFSSLDSKVSEGGLNLSQGQRQLLCLARVILTGASILVMDEATSSIDHETDAKIQEAIRETNYTVITIAHRLNTIMDYDRVLVLESGRVVEFESPKALLEVEGGVFRGMCEQTGQIEEFVKVAGKAWEERRV